MEALPRPLLEADAALHELFVRVAFSRYLNPTNAAEARAAFRSGAASEPPFSYLPADWADDELRFLDTLAPPLDHPLGRLLATSVERARLVVYALRDRTPAAFHALAEAASWYPTDADIEVARSESFESDEAAFVMDARALKLALELALDERGLTGWAVELDAVMSARVLVDGPKKLLRVNTRARFRQRDVRKLVAHEVEVHALRSAHGARQPLKLFATGTPNSLLTEEGLALVAEHRAGVVSPGTGWRQGVVVQAVHWARELGFRDLYERIGREAGYGLAWGIAQRLKRGLAEPGLPGVYAKDVVYYLGQRQVKDWLAAGHPVEHLFVGKVGIHDPVQDWIDAGWLTLQPVPALFRGVA